MAYQFADGFDNYTTFVAGYPWSTINGSPAVTVGTSRFTPPGSLPGNCMTVGSGTGQYVRYNLSSNQPTIIAGFGFMATSLPGSGSTDMFQLWDNGTLQLTLAINSNGALQFYRGGSQIGTAISTLTANNTIQTNVWYGLAISATINTTTGAVTLSINGAVTPAITGTGLNTQSTGNAYVSQISIGGTGNGNSVGSRYDDFYCFDGTGAFLNSALGGDARILTKMPSGAGNYTNWTPNGLGSNWQNVSQNPPSTSDYNANNVSTTKDAYAMQSASLAVAPYFVVARASLEKDDGATHTPSLFVRSSSTDSSGTVTAALTSGYLFYDAVYQNDPNTGSPWTGPAADAAQVGIIEG
jgi:hypothetical protein